MTNTIGIDVGGTSLRASVVDDHGRILDRERVPCCGALSETPERGGSRACCSGFP